MSLPKAQKDKGILFSGGYESWYCAIRYPDADLVYLVLPFDGKEKLEFLSSIRGLIMVSGYPEKRGIILTGVDVMREMGYRTIVVGVEDIKNYHYLFECERIERSRSYWDEYEKKYGVRVIFGCENLSKTDVVRKVLSVMRPEYIITCLDDNWSPSNPRCGKCVGCVDEFKILEKLGLEDPNFYF